jgi:MinD superfamily P-loop ATPase
VATNLALSLARGQSSPDEVGTGPDPRPLLIDCDVEEPNASLFLSPELTDRREVGQLIPAVDDATCTHCGRCAEVCQFNALAVVADRVLIFPELCHGCGSCTMNCPVGAIEEVLHVMGTIERGWAGRVEFAHGTLDIGEAMAVPVIRQLKQWAMEETPGNRPTIVDAPPGTACPVVETMRGADVALMVTEPTPFGLHDLRLAVEVARDELGLPVAVIVNRDGVGDDGVSRYCAAEQVPIVMRIPLDRRIAEAYSEGIPLVEALPAYRDRFVDLWERLGTIGRPEMPDTGTWSMQEDAG